MNKDAEALVSVTQTMLRLWYTDEVTFTAGDIVRAVRTCTALFNPDDGDAWELVHLQAVIELCKRYGVEI